jgi:2-polyprenyl-3-methyl-5-hydroxy-6-metoxy-1,4-benzoquinol methylase
MANILSFKDFSKIYLEALEFSYRHWTPEMQREIARHCYPWSPGLFDFKLYLQASAPRYYYAYRAILPYGRGAEICDVGGFWGVFPATLKALGYRVTMTESLQYYSSAFMPLFEQVARLGVKIMDYDPFKAGVTLSDRFDLITVMAVLEHYPHSLKDFMSNVLSLLNPEGKIYIEVPNIAHWPKRMSLLWGKTPLVNLKEIFLSEVPFIGHHHEFTLAELRELANLCGLRIIKEGFYNYSEKMTFKTLIKNPLNMLAYLFLKDSRECLTVLCEIAAGRGLEP